MKIKSFTAGFTGGIEGALEILDRAVNDKLGTKVIIHSVTDTYYNEKQTGHEPIGPSSGLLTRVVTYGDPS